MKENNFSCGVDKMLYYPDTAQIMPFQFRNNSVKLLATLQQLLLWKSRDIVTILNDIF